MAEYENGFVELRRMTPLRGWKGQTGPDETAGEMMADNGGGTRSEGGASIPGRPTYAAPAARPTQVER